jgi:hypothetical protein
MAFNERPKPARKIIAVLDEVMERAGRCVVVKVAVKVRSHSPIMREQFVW